MKKIAIIIVNYNCSKDTLETIDSLKKFNSNLFDIYLVDNNSRRDDLTTLKSNIASDIHFFELKSNLGFAGANNIAIKEAIKQDYSYIFLLNPDTLIEDINFFSVIQDQIDKFNPDIIGPMVRYFPEKDTIYFAGGFFNKYIGLTKMGSQGVQIKDYLNRKAIECDFITGCAIFVKKDVFKKVGLLPEEYFLYFEETDFCLKAKKLGFKIFFTPNTFIYHKVSSSIKYLSNTYIYYMIRNFKIFAIKYVPGQFKPLFYLYYFFVWVPGYLYLSLKSGNLKSVNFLVKGILNFDK